MPRTLAELKDSALAWSLVFIISCFAAILVYENQRISTLYEKNTSLSREFVRLERYQADRALWQSALCRIETNVDKLIMMAASKK